MPPRTAFIVTALTGALGWIALALLTGETEAWDNPAYFTVLLPLTALVVGIVAYLAPERAWRWAFVPFLAQAVTMALWNPSANLGLLPLGLMAYSVFGVLCLVPALAGAALAKRRHAA